MRSGVRTGDEGGLLQRVEFLRLDAGRRLDPERKKELGQFLTPAPVARLMASMVNANEPLVSILDPGAGVGSLFAAVVSELCRRAEKPKAIHVTAYEIDDTVGGYLPDTLSLCAAECERAGIEFGGDLRRADFIESAVSSLQGSLFATDEPTRYSVAIINPPYGKIHTRSAVRALVRSIGVETGNTYTAFLAAAIELLAPHGELVAITPRSFCNGVYFRPFRRFFLERVALDRAHVFESREQAFRDDEVLQENLIVHAIRRPAPDRDVEVTASAGPDDPFMSSSTVPYTDVVRPDDPESFIRFVLDDSAQQVGERMGRCRSSLADLGLAASTGRVVDFRARELLRGRPDRRSVPLIYPTHFERGYVAWPKPSTRKPNAIARGPRDDELLVPNGVYVLVRRFSAKEERRRIVAAIYDGGRFGAEYVGFENHLNYFHRDGRGLPMAQARGLAAFLNSTLADQYFRQFSGHTQVNAVDLRRMGYPSAAQLDALGGRIGESFPDQDELDRLVEEELGVADVDGVDPVRVKKRIDEAIVVLKALGFPRDQVNERSALVLLGLLDLKPFDPWTAAVNPLRGTTPVMDFAAEHYGKRYAANTRETVRRHTLHQFVDAGLAEANPDEPERPTNSPKFVYRIETGALELLRTFGTADWEKNLKVYLSSIETLKTRYAQAREVAKVPLKLAEGKTINLSPGGQNLLIKEIVDEFAPRFVPAGEPIYVGDTGEKFAYFDEDALGKLSVRIEAHGKMPDVIIYDHKRNWLVLIEAVTSHGPVNPKRRSELQKLFRDSKAGLVLVTAFLTRKAMTTYLNDISWETEVWVAEEPGHLIHFNGERFLGPY